MKVADCSFDTLLYEGSSTLVYAGVRDSDGAAVVAKIVGRGQRNLTHEYSVLEKVAGPGVVEALGLFESGVGPVLVQRRFGSGSLGDALAAGRFTVPRALRVALQLARVCERVHAARIVHRDIKPANILYDPKTDQIALGDFGIAAELPVNARALPVGDLIGTPGYVSPEHTGRTRGGCDVRSDLYSLGVTLYELLTGGLPFTERHLIEIVAAHLSKVPESPHHRLPSIPPVVSDIVMKLLAKLPDERYQSARGLASDLECCLATLALDGRIPSFELGRSDLLRPRFPARLFGRGEVMIALEQAYSRAATGAATLVLLSGREGSGRSELVRALVRDAPEGGPLALGGWRAANERPLSGLCDALGSLANGLLGLDEDYLAALRRQFTARLGQVGQVVVDIVPALGDVFGPQPALTELAAPAARARIQHGFRCLAAALGDAAPFVLALRGFDHADPSTVSLIEAMLNSPTSCRTLVVLIAQDPAAFGALRQRADAVSIALGPLPLMAMSEWIAATLDSEPGRAAGLGEVMHDKTAGNPLMFVRLLEHLVETGVIERRDGRYTWSLDAVRAMPPPPTLGSLAAQRIAELDEPTRRALAAIACAEGAAEIDVLVAMLEVDAAAVVHQISELERDGLVVRSQAGLVAAHPIIVETALAAVIADEVAQLHGRLGLHLLHVTAAVPVGAAALHVAMALSHGEVDLPAADCARAAELYANTGEYVASSIAYEAAAGWFAEAAAMLEQAWADAGGPREGAWRAHRALHLRIELGRARSLMMLSRNAEADVRLLAITKRDLSPAEIGITYASCADNRSMALDRAGAIDIGLEGLERLGIRLPREPGKLKPLAAVRLNQRYLSRLTPQDHVDRPDATDELAIAAVKILSTLGTPAVFTQRVGLYVLITETALSLILKYGHLCEAQGALALHAAFLHAMRGEYAAARRIYEACDALEAARPAPELVARNSLLCHYLVSPWFGSWQDATTKLARAIRMGVEVGDPVFAALCASASVTMLNLTGTPLDRMVAAVQGWGPFLRGDGGTAANAANIVNIAGKMTRGEPVTTADLERVSNVPLAAGPMRNNAMVNLGLALTVCGHEAQVRAWLDEIRPSFPLTNFAHPHRMTLWLLDGLFAAKDVRAGVPGRRAEAERILEIFRMLRRETQATNNDPAIAVLEAQLARADGDVDRAAGLFGRAAREARSRDLTPLVAYANEQRADMLDEAGQADEATLFYREAVIAYRRWAHMTKVHALEQAHPAVRARELGRGDDRRGGARATPPSTVIGTFATTGTATVGIGQAVNDQLDIVTVLRVSQDISTQLHGSGVVRAVLTGIAQNAGAERVVFVLRAASGVETVYGEVHGGAYRDIGVTVDDFAALPKSIVRVVRRTGRPLVVADATSEPSYAGDPFVVESRGRSIAVVPIRRKGEVTGFVVLENRMVAGAFTPQLVSLAQALVAQAAISLDNASLYKELENRVSERTAALHARNAEMRMVLDHVAQGLVMVGTDGRLFAERSAVLGTWFPDGVPDTLAGFFIDDPGTAAWFDIAWGQLIEGFMPMDLGIQQLPAQLRRGDRVLAFDWQPIVSEAGSLERMLVVLSDVTEALRRDEAEREQKQLMVVFENLSEDRNGVIEFLRETAVVVAELTDAGCAPELEKRLLHTLKGNSALFGLSALAARCHAIEDAMEVDARPMDDAEREGLWSAWNALHLKLSRFLDVGEGVIEVRRADFETTLSALRRDGHPAAHDIELWALEPLRMRLQRIGEQARALAERVGKGPVRVQIEHNGVHVDRDGWAPFWSAFVHVVRNAIDHGLEDAADRAQLGKGIATLTLRSYLRAGALVVEMSDDGRGIAWDKLADKARAAGLPTNSRKDLVTALFHDGISTRDEASELSGRGVGLGALAVVCQAMSCEIVVDSVPGQGTTMRFEFPGALARARRERPISREQLAVPPSA